ncbi:HNH endonuclease signature motif containing protein [Micromonospora sp. NPDC023644]|uniref:HNH endonuclease n=1 Tax=Micromonospora sp. NPDC023644 TaxID=3154321 RepID=UPI0033E26F72
MTPATAPARWHCSTSPDDFAGALGSPRSGGCDRPGAEDQSGGRGGGEEITRQDLIDYNIGVNRDPSKPTSLCSYCRQNPAEAVDHVEPRIHGGDRTDANLTPACRRCNSSKKDNFVPYNPTQGVPGHVASYALVRQMIQEWFMLHPGRQ